MSQSMLTDGSMNTSLPTVQTPDIIDNVDTKFFVENLFSFTSVWLGLQHFSALFNIHTSADTLNYSYTVPLLYTHLQRAHAFT